ncbi:MAG: triose-phosphate isomerase, partial [bacterium]
MAVAKALFFGGNWKAAMTPQQTREFFHKFATTVYNRQDKLRETGTRVVIAPPASSLTTARTEINNRRVDELVDLAIQDPWHNAGAYTGAETLAVATDRNVQARYAIIGHSETREPVRMIEDATYGLLENTLKSSTAEQVGLLERFVLEATKLDADQPPAMRLAFNAVINRMVKETLKVGMTPILCVGETAFDRDYDETEKVVLGQLTAGLAGITAMEAARVIVAYEPVWAIG